MLVSNLPELGILVRNVAHGPLFFEFASFWYNFPKDPRNFDRDPWAILEVCFCGATRESSVSANESLPTKGVTCPSQPIGQYHVKENNRIFGQYFAMSSGIN